MEFTRRELTSPEKPHKQPKNPEAYNAAFEWLQQHDPIDIIDEMPDGDEKEKIALAFTSVYWDHTDARDYHGFYSPVNWGIRAAFVYGYLSGLEEAKGNVTMTGKEKTPLRS